MGKKLARVQAVNRGKVQVSCKLKDCCFNSSAALWMSAVCVSGWVCLRVGGITWSGVSVLEDSAGNWKEVVTVRSPPGKLILEQLQTVLDAVQWDWVGACRTSEPLPDQIGANYSTDIFRKPLDAYLSRKTVSPQLVIFVLNTVAPSIGLRL